MYEERNMRHGDPRGTTAPLWPHKMDVDDFCSGAIHAAPCFLPSRYPV